MPEPKHTFTIILSCRLATPDPLQSSTDSILWWCGDLTAMQGIRLLNDLKTLVEKTGTGSMNPISASASNTLDALGKDKQIPLPGCAIKRDS